jgi:tetratricopeptide (TPR) repeat protein
MMAKRPHKPSKSDKLDASIERIDGYLKAANACGERGDYEGVITQATRALEVNPDIASAYYLRGMAHSALGDAVSAVMDLQESVALNSLLLEDLAPDTVGMLGESAAEAFAQPILDQVYHALMQMGIIFNDTDGAQLAVNCFDQVLELNPNAVEAYIYRGQAHFQLGNYRKAAADCSRALSMASPLPTILMQRGLAYARLKELDRALADFTKAISLRADNGAAYEERGEVYIAQGKPDLALADFQEVLDLDSTDPFALAGLAAAHSALGRLDEARAAWQRLVELEPEFENRDMALSDIEDDQPLLVEELTRLLDYLYSPPSSEE